MASQTTEQMKRALLGGYDEQGEEQTGLFGYLSAPGQYLRGGLSDVLSWLPGGVPAHGFTGRKMWGEDVLREHLGMENQPGLDMTDVLGTGMDLLVDPLNLLYGAGAIKGGLKAARMLPKLLSSAGRAESLAAAKAAMAGLPAAAKAHAPGLAMGLGVPMAGAQLMGTNEEGSDWKDLVGMGMMTLPMALPLGMAAARKMKGGRAAAAKEALQPTKQGPFYSRLEEALLNAPEKFETRPEAVRVVPAKTITHPQTGAIIKEIPEQQHVTPGATAYEQMRSYLEGRAHPQEIDWVLGDQFADQPNISKQAMLDAYNEAKIRLETQRHGGAKSQFGFEVLPEGQLGPIEERLYGTPVEAKEALRAAHRQGLETVISEDTGVTQKIAKRQHGPLNFPDMLIPGGKNATEVPIKLGMPKPEPIYDELGHYRGDRPQGFPDTAGHFGDDVVAWTIHDQRKMPDGKTATFVQELQSDWHQQGAKKGYKTQEALSAQQHRMGIASRRRKLNDILQSNEFDKLSASEKSAVIAEEESLTQAMLQHDAQFGLDPPVIPNAPFKGNEWTKLAMKQAMADAIARGDDYVLLPPPELVSRTQGMPIEKARKFYGEIVPNLANEMLKPHGTKLEKMPLPGVGRRFSVISTDSFGARKTRYFDTKGQAESYSKQHGGTVAPSSEAESLGFHIPDSLRKQVQTKGFPLMQVGLPLAAAAGLGAYAASQEGT